MEGETGLVVGVLLNYIKSAQVKWLKSYPIPRYMKIFIQHMILLLKINVSGEVCINFLI